jgi:hypothetical protein
MAEYECLRQEDRQSEDKEGFESCQEPQGFDPAHSRHPWGVDRKINIALGLILFVSILQNLFLYSGNKVLVKEATMGISRFSKSTPSSRSDWDC